MYVTLVDEKAGSVCWVAAGTDKLQYSFIGHKNRTSAPVAIAKGADISVGLVNLPPDVRTLDAIEVTGQLTVIDEKVDRLVHNAERALTAKGGDAAAVMRRVPMLIIDLDGNLPRCCSNFQLLINNKRAQL